MKSINIKTGSLSLMLLVAIALTATSCASSPESERGIAQEQKSDAEQTPHTLFQSKKFEPNNPRF